MSEDQNKRQERIDFLVEEIKLNRTLRYYNRQKYSAQACDEMEKELRKLDPYNPLFYEITKKESITRKILKSLIIIIFAVSFLIFFVWFFYMFYYDPIIHG